MKIARSFFLALPLCIFSTTLLAQPFQDGSSGGQSGSDIGLGPDPGIGIIMPPIPIPEPAPVVERYAFSVTLDRHTYYAGGVAKAGLNLELETRDELAMELPEGEEGCQYLFNIRNTSGEIVHQSLNPCPVEEEPEDDTGEDDTGDDDTGDDDTGEDDSGEDEVVSSQSGSAGSAQPSLREGIPVDFCYGPWEMACQPPGPPTPSSYTYTYEANHGMELVSLNSELGEADGTPLANGGYLLEASLVWPGPEGEEGSESAGQPMTMLPFQIMSCDGEDEDAGSSINFMSLSRGTTSQYGYDDPDFTGEDLVFYDAESFENFWQLHAGGAELRTPRVDFDSQMVIATVMGLQSSDGGPNVTITEVEEGNCEIEVTLVKDEVPGMLDAISNPYHLIRIDFSNKPITFRHLRLVEE
ncbi:MAG: protease complex subunit PrcB family protein [Magnetococcales bacterium]|nr:protease complex subunit PrcB family protein [Magnetococcales bacterium]